MRFRMSMQIGKLLLIAGATLVVPVVIEMLFPWGEPVLFPLHLLLLIAVAFALGTRIWRSPRRRSVASVGIGALLLIAIIWMGSLWREISVRGSDFHIRLNCGELRYHELAGAKQDVANAAKDYFGIFRPGLSWRSLNFPSASARFNEAVAAVSWPILPTPTWLGGGTWLGDGSHRLRFTLASLHLWIPFVLMLSFLAPLVLRRNTTKSFDECAHCRYTLRDNVTGVCPECGNTIPPEQRSLLHKMHQVDGCEPSE